MIMASFQHFLTLVKQYEYELNRNNKTIYCRDKRIQQYQSA